jgi:hypothetical protein
MSFHSNLRDVTKARSYPSGAQVRHASLELAPDLTHKYFTKLERFARDKHSSLFCLFVSGKEKRFTVMTLAVIVIKLFLCHMQ